MNQSAASAPLGGGRPAVDVDECWGDPDNWKVLFGRRVIYSARRDPRVVVPKQPVAVGSVQVPLGWTLNFAHPEAHISILMLAAFGWRMYKR